MNVKIRPHDLRRHSATYASRNGIPPEVISKVILRHQDLKTTQMYLGRMKPKRCAGVKASGEDLRLKAVTSGSARA
jgi:integrase